MVVDVWLIVDTTFQDVYLAESPTPVLAEGEDPPHPLVPACSVLFSTTKRKSSSIVDQYGVRIAYPKGSIKGYRWFCLTDGCFNHGKGTKLELSATSTNKATEHLAKKHGIMATKTVSAAANAGRLNRLLDTSTPGFRASPSRFYQLQFAAWAAEHSIPFNAFKGDSWNLIANTLPAVDRKALMNLDVAKYQFEQYLCIKSKLITAFNEARAFYNGIPFLSFNVDLYQNSILNQKFLAVRLSWTFKGIVMSKNIGIRLYNPSYAERDQQQASDLLLKWSSDLLKEFNIDIEDDVFSSIGDGGSDVRCVMDKLMTGLREWCIGHIVNLCLIDAFGAHHDKSKSKNLEARAVIDAVRKCIEQVNKSSKLKARLEELLANSLGHVIKLKNSPHHRWSAIQDVLSRVLLQWQPLTQAYASVGLSFPLQEYKVVLQEFYSVLVPVRQLQVKSQAMRTLTCVSSFLAFVKLFVRTLAPNSCLQLIHPESGDTIIEERPPVSQDPRTVVVKALLQGGFLNRYFYRHHPFRALKEWKHVFGKKARKNKTFLTENNITLNDFKADYVFEMQYMMHPRGRELSAIKKAIEAIPIGKYPKGFPLEMQNEEQLRDIFFRLLEAALWRHIRDNVARVYSKLDVEVLKSIPTSKSVPSAVSTPPPSTKRIRLADDFEDLMDDAPNSQSTVESLDNMEEVDEEPKSPVERANEEVAKYKLAVYDRSECANTEKLLSWWGEKNQTEDYLCLPKVAGCLLAMKPGTGGLECDIGGVGDVISPKRGSISPSMVEVAMMIKLNKTDIERDVLDAPRLGNNWREYLPGRAEYPEDYFEYCFPSGGCESSSISADYINGDDGCEDDDSSSTSSSNSK